MTLRNNIDAFSTVEVILAIALFALVVTALAGGLAYNVQANADLTSQVRASYLADEGLEAVRNLRDSGFANLQDGSYQLAIMDDKWALQPGIETISSFQRSIAISTVDEHTKQVSSQVSWSATGGSKQITLNMYLTNWLRSVALGDWSALTQTGALDLSGSQNGLKVQVAGDYAYIIRDNATPDFVIVDITNPVFPTVTGGLSLAGTPSDLAVSGNYAYVTSDNNSTELQVIDITVPAAPALAAQLNLASNADAVAIALVGTNAFVVRDFAGGSSREFNVVNVANPLLPSVTGSLDFAGGNSFALAVDGNYVYIATDQGSQEVKVVDITNLAAPTLAGGFNLSGNLDAVSVAKYGSTLLIGADDDKVYVLNASNPLSLSLISDYTAGGLVNDIALNQTYTLAFLGTDNPATELQVVNIATPSALTLLSSADTANAINGLAYKIGPNLVFAVSSDNANELLIFSSL